jgi:hypothetical protein
MGRRPVRPCAAAALVVNGSKHNRQPPIARSGDPHFYVGFATLRAATLFGVASCALNKGLSWRSWRE